MDELRAKRPAILKLEMYKTVWNNKFARFASRKLSSIELEMYQQYTDEFRAKCEANFEARNVQNCMKLCTN